MALFGGKSTDAVTEDAVLQALRAVQDPELHQDVVSLGLVKALEIQGGRVSFTLEFTTHSPHAKVEIHSQARKAVAKLPGVSEVKVGMGSRAPAARSTQQAAVPEKPDLIPAVKHTLAVSSGKGGVGKSTVAVNLALAFQESGASVGLVDADVYGPNIPLMMGARGRPGMFQNRIIPVLAYGVKIISIGFFIKEGDPVVWRGPMIHSAIQQFLRDVEWGELDYLIFDMPPGTGDAQLSLSQVLPLSGAVMVTTPQDVSLLDVRKGLAMFRKMNVPLLGVVENMAGFTCPHCQHTTPIFGEGGGQRLADEFGIPVLGSIPLDLETRVGGDTGSPILVARPESSQAEAFRKVASAVAARLSTLTVLKLPTIS
ncbi:MAG TPA: Mrp/NBP35 family ATP-binding protein [Methylomirabilota bacterium]|jgi:ATP-binding protein involved in chromosome partitioning|nr:Mrp/NBP35 family ATP-binding protein [Methylomirabilota bacterium]